MLDLDAEHAIDLADAAGCRAISFWLHAPWPGFSAPCRIDTAAKVRAVRARLRESGLRAVNMEVFELSPTADPATFAPALELGAEVGCTAAAVIFGDDPEPARQVDQFAALCRIAARSGLRVNAEFISYRQLATLGQAAALIAEAGEPNGGITIDLLHLVRSGGTPADVAAISPGLIGHAQLCDGPRSIDPEERRAEASSNRLIPGEGDFPVKAFRDALPALPLGLEVPYNAPCFAGLTPSERVARLVEATRRAL